MKNRLRLSVLAVAVLSASFLVSACSNAAGDSTATGSPDALTEEASSTLLVSDIDDTIKRTDVLNKLEAAVNALGTTNEFAGMSTLYTAWHDEETNNKKITYLSAAPGPLVIPGIRFLEGSHFPGNTADVSESVVSGRKFTETAGAFKTARLLEFYDASVAAGTVPNTVILIGDNGEQDMLAYSNYITYVASKGGRTDRIYSFIHHAYDSPEGSEIVAPHRTFVTAADLAVQLKNLSLISAQALDVVLRDVAVASAGSQANTVIPSFMTCSQFSAWPALDEETGADDYNAIQTNVNRLCENSP
jgi:hypothetical protein